MRAIRYNPYVTSGVDQWGYKRTEDAVAIRYACNKI